MALDNFDLQMEFTVAARFTASGDTDITLVNPSNPYGYQVWWLTTDDDTLPVVDFRQCPSIKPGEDRPMQLPDGKRLWMVGEPGFTASVHS